MIGGHKFYDRKEIRDALAYFRLVVNPEDDMSFNRIVNEPKRGIGNTSVEKLEALPMSMTGPCWKQRRMLNSVRLLVKLADS